MSRWAKCKETASFLAFPKSLSPWSPAAVAFRNLTAANVSRFRREDRGRSLALLMDGSALFTLSAPNSQELVASSHSTREDKCHPRHSSMQPRQVTPPSANFEIYQVKTPRGSFYSLRKLKRVVFCICGNHHSKISNIDCFTDYTLTVILIWAVH